jgi:hypothetical protein
LDKRPNRIWWNHLQKVLQEVALAVAVAVAVAAVLTRISSTLA